MPWYDYLMWFFGGAFLANGVPHFTRGVSGDPFPTPFAHPPGRGLSPAWLNVMWGILNLLAGYALLRYGKFALLSWPAAALAFAGALLMGLQLSITFASKEKSAA